MSNLDQYTVEELDRENKELKNRNAILGGFVTKVRSECRKRSEVKDDFFSMMVDSCNRILEQALSQSLADIKADAIEELIKEKAYSASIDGIATSIIDADGAIQYADKLRAKS